MTNSGWWRRQSAAERSLRGQVAALGRTDRGPDRTAAARSGRRARLYDQTDPALPPEQRAELVEAELRKHMARMSLAAAAARRRAREALAQAELAEALVEDARQAIA